jgi:protein SCO1
VSCLITIICCVALALVGAVSGLAMPAASAQVASDARPAIPPSARTIPDAAAVDQDGRSLSFYRDLVQGHTVAIDFIFTGCSTFCRPVTANLRATQEALGDRVGKDLRLISISVDPANDTPARLKQYAAQFEAGAGWSFVTGSKAEIDRLLDAFGVGTHGPEDHSSLTLVLNDATGSWHWTDSLASPEAIAAALLQASSSGAAGPTPAHAADAAARPDRARIAAVTAAYIPNVELLNQDGKIVHFFDDLVKDKVVLLDFIYTQCTEACSPLTQNLADVQDLLGDRVGRSISMISVSVDPEHDTPPALKAFADKFGARPGWSFVTGSADNLSTLAHRLGGVMTTWQDHSTQIVIGNVPTGEWAKMNGMLAPELIAKSVLQIAAGGS